MRAALLPAIGENLDIRDDVTLTAVGSDDVRVRIKATGVCHSDLSVISGRLPSTLPAIPGHEGAGEVVEVGDRVTSVRPGDHVIINWVPACGTCTQCVAGQPNLCMTHMFTSFTQPRFRYAGETPAFGMMGCGTWAEEIIVPWQGAIPIDPELPYDIAALIGCGVTTGVGAVLNIARVRPGSTVAVVGCGGVGLSVIQGARLSGATTILAIDPLESKRALAERLGATHACTPDQVADFVGTLTGGQGFDYGFEVVGRSAAIMTAWQATRRGGNVIVVGVGGMEDQVPLSAFALGFEGKNLLNALYGGSDVRRDFPRLINLHRAGKLDLESLISARIELTDLNDAVAALKSGEALRQIVIL